MGASEQTMGRQLTRQNGRDEMNLAEFPITLLADRAPKGQKPLVFRDGEQTLTVTGSNAFGLPTAIDADVIVALIALTKQANNFTNPTVPFTRYSLLRLLGWPNKGSNYQRLTQSLKCWTGVTLNYEKAWWDNKAKRKVDATFHIIESVVIESVVISESSILNDDEPGEHSSSTFTWSRRFFESCRVDNLKRLDLETYFSLESSVSKRMYRFLDKRFFHKQSLTFDLQEFAHDHVGLGRNYADNGKLKEKLGPAIKELEAIGYLEPMSREQRYSQVKRGQWTITLARKTDATSPEPAKSTEEGTALEKELIALGITASRAKVLVSTFPADRIGRQLEHVSYIQAKHPSGIRSLGGYLRKAIEDDYAAPPGFVSKAELARREEHARAKSLSQAEDRKRLAEAEARENAEEEQVAAYLDSRSMSQLEELDREILAIPENRESYDKQFKQFPRFKRLFLDSLRKARVRQVLGLPPGS